MKFVIEFDDDNYFKDTLISIIGPGLEYRQDSTGRGINCTGLDMTNDDQYVMHECSVIISCMRNIIATRKIREE